MRNFDAETDKLAKEIRALDLKKSEKELELRKVHKEKQKSKVPVSKKTKKKLHVARDKARNIISIGDWVKVTTPGRFLHNEGEVISYNKWITFTDITD